MMHFTKISSFTLAGFMLAGFAPFPAYAHFGHLGEVAGHGHMIAAGIAGVAAVAAIWLGKKKPVSDDATIDGDDEVQDEITDETASQNA